MNHSSTWIYALGFCKIPQKFWVASQTITEHGMPCPRIWANIEMVVLDEGFSECILSIIDEFLQGFSMVQLDGLEVKDIDFSLDVVGVLGA